MEKKNEKREYHKNWINKNPEYMATWRGANGERMKKTNKAYYQKHKEKILETFATPITCECGKTMRRNNYFRHLRSISHQAFEKRKLDSNA